MENAASSSRIGNVNTGFSRDYSSEFKATEKFTSREELEKWACNVGRSNGFDIITLRSDSGGGSSKKRPRVILGCKRSGKPDIRTPKKVIPLEERRKGSGSKKCGCPFKLKGQLAGEESGWELTVVGGMHNHAVEDSFPVRLTKEDKSLIKDLYSNKSMKPREILKTLKQRDKHNKSTLRTIYNAQKGLKLDYKKLQLQKWLSRLSNKLSLYGHIQEHRTCPETDHRDFFMTHPNSLELLRAFPWILKISIFIMLDTDCSLNISGITSTEIEFSVAYVYLCSQRRDNLVWALNTLRGVISSKKKPLLGVMDGFAMPRVVIVNFERWGLMKAIKDVFGDETKILLNITRVRWDIGGVGLFDSRERQWCFQKKWEKLIRSPTVPKFEQELMELQIEFSSEPRALDYVTKTWLNPYKEIFVPAWTNKFMHLGIQTSHKFYRYHLTEYFWDIHFVGGRPDLLDEDELEDKLKKIHRDFEWEHRTIYDSFNECLTAAEIDEFRIPELNELVGVVSTNALERVREQCMQASDVIISDDCDCVIRSIYGLPCHHEIAKYKRDNRPIPLECVHPHWKTINVPLLTQFEENSKEMMDLVEYARQQQRQSEKEEYHVQFNAVDEFEKAYPAWLKEYILEVKDVPRDGHCGFRAISSMLGNNDETGWRKVREDLINELKFNGAHYYSQLYSDQQVDELIHSLNCFDKPCLHKEHWMTMPDMGHIIASCYNVVLVHLSSVQCFTFLPLRTAPISVSSPTEIAIGFLHEHFVQVILKQGHPMPPLAPTPISSRVNMPPPDSDWERFHKQRCTEWASRYTVRMEHFKSLQPKVVLQKNPTVIDIDLLPSDDGDVESRIFMSLFGI